MEIIVIHVGTEIELLLFLPLVDLTGYKIYETKVQG